MNDLSWLASLIKSRNTIDSKISALIGHSAQPGNVAGYIASNIFKIELDETGKARGYDGHFMDGPLAGYSVDIQWHPKHDGQLTIKPGALPDYYLVFAGSATSSIANPWLINAIFLFHSGELLNALRERGVQIGNSTSVTGPLWERAEIYPMPRNTRLPLSDQERRMLILFT